MTYATVRAATSPELAYLRTAGKWSRLYLAFLQPPTVYTARLASLPSTGDRVVEIAFTSGSGTLANVFRDMTMYVGSAAGAYDLGIARIRNTPIAGTFYIGEESEIGWQANCYLTVVADFDLWAKHIRTVSDTEFYIDYDIVYTDQNSVFDPIPIMGGHRVIKLTGASVSTIFNFSNSYVIDSTISAYSAFCPTASSSSGTTTSTPTFTFNTPGWHPVYLDVTAANGKVFRGVRYVYVYSSSAMPATVFELGECSEDYEAGGWSFTVTMQDQIALSSVPDRAMCILFAEEFYGDTQISIGQLAGCENIICIGKIAEESYSINAEMGEVTLRVQGYQHWFSHIHAFPTGVLQVTTTPTNWVEMESPTADKVVYRLLRWGCTATRIMDVYLTNDVRLAAELTSPASNLWAQLQELALSTIHARPGIDQYGRMFVEVEPQLVPSADRTWPSIMTLTSKDWQEKVTVQRMVVDDVGMFNVSGVTIDATGSGGAFFALTPGHVFKHYGSIEVIDRLLLSTQPLTKQLAGLLLGWRNNPFPNSEFQLAGNNRMIDCFPRQKVAWSTAVGDTPRGFALSGNFIPRRVSRSWDNESGFLETSVTLELESVEQLSTNGDILGDGSADLSTPPRIPAFPPLPPFPIILPTDITPVNVLYPIAVLHDLNPTGGGLYYTTTFNTTPAWQAMNAGLTPTQAKEANFFRRTIGGVCYCGKTNETDDGFLARAPALGSAWTVLFDQSNLADLAGSGWGVKGFAVNELAADTVGVVLRRNSDGCHFWLGIGGSFSVKSAMATTNSFHWLLTFGLNQWLATQYSKASTIVADGSSQTPTTMTDGDFSPGQVRASTTGKTYHERNGGGLFIGENNLATWTENTDTKITFAGSPGSMDPYFACDPTGQYMMSRYDTGARGKSGDFGFTWNLLPALLFAPWWFEYAGGSGTSSRWIAAGGSLIYISEDFGSSWNPNLGNLTTLLPIPDINLVKAYP